MPAREPAGAHAHRTHVGAAASAPAASTWAPAGPIGAYVRHMACPLSVMVRWPTFLILLLALVGTVLLILHGLSIP